MDDGRKIPSPKSGDALILVDVQNDFLPGGTLAVPCGDEVLPVLNGYIDFFHERGLPILATRDWHPGNHCSFREQGGLWPAHCVADSAGAQFSPKLRLPATAEIVSKGTQPDQEAYSGFQGTPLHERLESRGIHRLFIGGLATDYCVLNTVKDARQLGYTVYLLEDAVRAVNVHPDDGCKAIGEMVSLGSRPCTLEQLQPSWGTAGPLLTDLYQLTMMQGYFDQNMNDIAVFEFFVRELPPDRGFLVAAGLEQVLQYLETLRFPAQDLDWLESCGYLRTDFVKSLEGFRFTGDVDALPEGAVFFANEPILRVTAPLPQAQLVESRIINLLQHQILVASKAARCVLAAPGKVLIDFGFRRAHGAEAGLLAARASYIAGFTGTATVQAGVLWNIPVFGTMAHSFIQAHDGETRAFENFARSHPGNVILLLDTYDTEKAVRKLVDLAPGLREDGITIRGVRLDSGDLAGHACRVRGLLDAGGLPGVKIFASGDLDERKLLEFRAHQAPIDGFGIGTRLTTSADAPMLNCAYKLQEYAGSPRRKLSENKASLPGRKQVYRQFNAGGEMTGDLVTLEEEVCEGQPLLEPCLRQGQKIRPAPPLAEARDRAARDLGRLPEHLRALKNSPPYSVEISSALKNLADTMAPPQDTLFPRHTP
ncbi:MAG: nicotinate phosphoribosyltransferase [Nitrospinaceae bacterium]